MGLDLRGLEIVNRSAALVVGTQKDKPRLFAGNGRGLGKVKSALGRD